MWEKHFIQENWIMNNLLILFYFIYFLDVSLLASKEKEALVVFLRIEEQKSVVLDLNATCYC